MSVESTNRPNFFVIGAPKTGTTALCQYLSEHPDVFISTPKEPFYWCSDFPNSKALHRMTSLENYLDLFAAAEPKHRRIGEGSTTYMQSKQALASIAEFNPQAKLIAMLRNPIDVAHGMHGELVRHFLEDEPDFEKAWGLQEQRARGERLPPNHRMDHQLQYGDVATFYPQLERFFRHFPADQRLVIIFDDFAADTGRIYQRILDFLGLADDGRTEFPRVHAAKVFRNQFAGRMYHDPPAMLEPVVRRFRTWFISNNGWLKRSISFMASKKRPRDPLRAEFRSELKTYFRNDIQQVSDLLGRNLMDWVE